jgi:lipopolysaccharide assembly protein B
MTIDSTSFVILLLIAAAVFGWLLAHWGRGRRRESRFKSFSSEYFKGLNFLLNEQPDKALEVFIRVAEVDSDTVETHFALGNLFRRRGEVDRAIRIHQNLIARPTLTRAHRAQALFELAEDYMHAGLLDRAEAILLDLLDMPNYTEPALLSLIALYEQQKDWDQAISMRRRLQTHTGSSEEETIAQYYCELAQAALTSNDRTLARRHLKRSKSHDPNCIRANLLMAQMEEADQAWERSQEYYKQVLVHEIRFAAEVLPALLRVSRHLGSNATLHDSLDELLKENPSASGHIAIAAILHPEINDSLLQTCVADYLRTEPSMHGLYEMFMSISKPSDASKAVDLGPLQATVRNFLINSPRYRCEECGFRSKTLYWQCPSCKTWNRTTPFQEISFTTTPLPATQ